MGWVCIASFLGLVWNTYRLPVDWTEGDELLRHVMGVVRVSFLFFPFPFPLPFSLNSFTNTSIYFFSPPSNATRTFTNDRMHIYYRRSSHSTCGPRKRASRSSACSAGSTATSSWRTSRPIWIILGFTGMFLFSVQSLLSTLSRYPVYHNGTVADGGFLFFGARAAAVVIGGGGFDAHE